MGGENRLAGLLGSAIRDALRTEGDPSRVRFYLSLGGGPRFPCRTKVSVVRGIEFAGCLEHEQTTLESLVKDALDVGLTKLSDIRRFTCPQGRAFCEPTSFEALLVSGSGVRIVVNCGLASDGWRVSSNDVLDFLSGCGEEGRHG